MGEGEKLTSGTEGGPVFVYVQDDRIIRITPMEFDASGVASRVIEARGRRFSPPRKTCISPFVSLLKETAEKISAQLYYERR
jgi:hypothetical protein